VWQYGQVCTVPSCNLVNVSIIGRVDDCWSRQDLQKAHNVSSTADQSSDLFASWQRVRWRKYIGRARHFSRVSALADVTDAFWLGMADERMVNTFQGIESQGPDSIGVRSGEWWGYSAPINYFGRLITKFPQYLFIYYYLFCSEQENSQISVHQTNMNRKAERH